MLDHEPDLTPEFQRPEQPPRCRPMLFETLALGERHLARAFRMTPRTQLPARSAFTSSGRQTQQVYWLRLGWAYRARHVANGRRQILDFYLPGDLIGCDCVLLTNPQDPVFALTDCTYYALDHESIMANLGVPEVSARLMWMMLREQRRIEALTTWLGRFSAEERIAVFLLDLYGRLRESDIARGHAFVCPLTQHQLADHLGMTVIHANRVLRQLRERQIVTMQLSMVNIHDIDQLGAIARPSLPVAPPLGGEPS
jgi:CRP-like cAMP-binding protein